MPASQCGSLIGKGGAKIKEIREVGGPFPFLLQVVRLLLRLLLLLLLLLPFVLF